MSAPYPLARLLEAHPLPAADGDKHDRGVAVLVAGSDECPGAAALSAIAALRVGAGKVQVITAPGVAPFVGIAVPEALVLEWNPASPDPRVEKRLAAADAVVIGPGIMEGAVDTAMAAAQLATPGTPLLLDARALPAARDIAALGRRLALAPNVDEANEVLSEPPLDRGVEALAVALSAQLRVPVAVRGETTVLAAGESAWWTDGAPGLGTSGSGDVLAGAVTGLLARGLEPIAALGWGVAVHIEAARLLAEDRENPGYLARELLDVIPAAIGELVAGARHT